MNRCIYREIPGHAPCNKVCDPGKTLCPHHELLQESQPMFPDPQEIPAGSARQKYKTPKAYQE
jgi:hypothetical protein